MNTDTLPTRRRVRTDIDRAVQFQYGSADPVTGVVAEIRRSAFDTEISRLVGFLSVRLGYIYLPNLVAFLGGYGSTSIGVILVDPPGPASRRLCRSGENR